MSLPYTIRRRATIQDRILEYVRALERSASPYEIAQSLKLNRKTTATILGRLTSIGCLVKEARGLYCCNPTYGVGGATKPIRVQNLTVVASDVSVKPEDSGRVETFEYPDISGEKFRVSIKYGAKRGKLTYTAKALLGLDRYGFLLVHEYVKAKLEARGYMGPYAWLVVNYELLEDYIGIKIDGAKSITLDAFDTMLIKVYEKSFGLRKEVRGSRPAQLNDILALTMGGLPTYQLMQANGVTMVEIRNLTAAISRLVTRDYEKGLILNAQTAALTRVLDALYNEGLIKAPRKEVKKNV